MTAVSEIQDRAADPFKTRLYAAPKKAVTMPQNKKEALP